MAPRYFPVKYTCKTHRKVSVVVTFVCVVVTVHKELGNAVQEPMYL